MGPDAERGEELPHTRALSDHRPGAGSVAVRARGESGGRQPERSARSEAQKPAIPSAGADAPLAKRRVMSAVLEVKNLRVKFVTASGIARAVDGIDFSIAPSRTLGVVGESGCGKTVTSR